MNISVKHLLFLPLLLVLFTILACQPSITIPQPATAQPPVEPTPASSASPAKPFVVGRDITPVAELGITAPPPENLDIEQYRLTIDGLVETPLSLTYDQLLQYDTVTQVVLLVCPGAFVDYAEWTGIPVSTLLDEAGINPEATEVRFYSVDDYRATMDLDLARNEGVFLAHTVNGQILPPEHGFPVRLVVEDELGEMWVKWVGRIEVRE